MSLLTKENDGIYFDLYPEVLECLDNSPKKGARTKKKVFEATLKSLSKLGIEKISFQSIAKEAKLTPSNIIYFFPDKNKLIELAVVYSMLTSAILGRKKTQELPPGVGAREQLTVLIERDFEHFKEIKHRYGLAIESYLCGYKKSYSKFYSIYRNRGAKRVKAIIAGHLSSKGYKDEFIARRALDIQMLVSGYVLDYVSIFLEEERSEYRAYAIEACLMLAELNT